VQFLEISIDPGRDDVRRLAAYAALYGRAPNWHVLTAGAGTDQLWKTLGVYYRRVPSEAPPPKDWLTGRPLTYDIEHQDAVFVIDAKGHERWITQGSPSVGASAVPTPMRTFLDEQGRSNLASPSGPVWTSSDVLAAVSAVTGERPAP
jgi:protein SCO1/2